jgi:hypothetical protein
LWEATEDVMGRLPTTLLVAVAGTFSGAAWEVTHPVKETLHNGTVLEVPSFLPTVLVAFAGGVASLVVIGLLAFAFTSARYRLRGDPAWKARIEGDLLLLPLEAVGCALNFRLDCVADPPIAPFVLGEVKCEVRYPSGATAVPVSVTSRQQCPAFFATFAPAVTAEQGTFSVRWYASDHRSRWREVARAKRTITTGGTEP